MLRVQMDRNESSEYLQLLNALLHLCRQVSNTPGQAHVERWILHNKTECADSEKKNLMNAVTNLVLATELIRSNPLVDE